MEWKALLIAFRDFVRWCLRMCLAPVISLLVSINDLTFRLVEHLEKI